MNHTPVHTPVHNQVHNPVHNPPHPLHAHFRWLGWLAFALALLLARPAGALDGGHLRDIDSSRAEPLYDAFIAPVYHLADDGDQNVVTAFENPLPGFEKKIRFAIVMYLDRAAAQAEALAASERDGRKYVLKVTTLARVLKHLALTADQPPSADYRQPDILVVEDRAMKPLDADYFVADGTGDPFTVTLGRFRYTPVFFSNREAAQYEAGIERHTGKAHRRVSVDLKGLLRFMEEHLGTGAEVRVFGYDGPSLVRDYHRSVLERVEQAAEQTDTSRTRLIRGSDPTDNERLKRRRGAAAAP